MGFLVPTEPLHKTAPCDLCCGHDTDNKLTALETGERDEFRIKGGLSSRDAVFPRRDIIPLRTQPKRMANYSCLKTRYHIFFKSLNLAIVCQKVDISGIKH